MFEPPSDLKNLKELEPRFFCACNEDCSKCMKPEKKRRLCVVIRATDCRYMSSPDICPCLVILAKRREDKVDEQ